MFLLQSLATHFRGSWTLEEILLFCAAMQFFGMNKCMVWTLLLLWDAL